MKKNLVVRIAAIVLMCTLVTACFASSTFARYTSTGTATDTLTVANWSFEVNDDDITDSAFASLFGANEKIYPGYEKTVDFKVENTSEVAATYVISFTVSKPENVNLQFKQGNTVLTPDAKGVYTLTSSVATLNASTGTATEKLTVTWVDSANDTAAGIAGGTVTITSSVTATQA